MEQEGEVEAELVTKWTELGDVLVLGILAAGQTAWMENVITTTDLLEEVTMVSIGKLKLPVKTDYCRGMDTD